MLFFNRLTAVLLAALLIAPVTPLEARTKKGDKFLASGRAHEDKKEWDAALEDYEKALSEDPNEMVYMMAVDKSRFQAGQMHIDRGLKARVAGQLGEALLEFQKAYSTNPGSAAAEQETVRTQQMIQRERKRVEETGRESAPQDRGLTPVQEAKRNLQDRVNRLQGVPELKPSSPRTDLKMNGQKSRVIFDTLGKIAGLNVLWDPEYVAPPSKDQFNVDFQNTSIEEALDYVAVLTKSFWKALSPNTIFITNDNPNKRRDYEEQVTKVFYLSNVNTPQDLQEIVTAVRGTADCNRLFAYNAQNAIIAKCEADRIALAEKIINDLDKPKSEVVVDIIVMEASSVYTRQLAAAVAANGLSLPIAFTPRSGLRVVSNPATTTPATTTPATTPSTTDTTTTTATNAVPLGNLGKITEQDFSTVLPSGIIQAVMSDARTKVLQAPQVRSVDNQKASLKIGEREPTASGSFQPGIGGVGINPLVNTQFNYIDVGVNVDLTPRVHENGEISMHVELDISNVTGTVNLGGIDQPIIGQRKITHDVRMREGEVNLLGGLINVQDTKSVTGVPGLSSIPLLGKLFQGQSIDRQRRELMIAIIPHIIRRPEITAENLRGVAAGNAQTVKVTMSPREEAPARPPAADSAAAPAAGTPSTAPGAAATRPVPPAAVTNPPAVTPGPGVPPAPPATAPPVTTPPATAPPATAPALLPPATALPPVPGAVPAGSASVHFQPATVEANLSSAFTVTLVVENGTDVGSAPMAVQFDPKILRINDVTRGEFLANDGQQPVFTKNIMNDTGNVTIQLSRMPNSAGVSGSGNLVSFSFQAIGRGSTSVTVPNLTVRNSASQAISTSTPALVVNVK
jgi:general secretion pathway protein D